MGQTHIDSAHPRRLEVCHAPMLWWKPLSAKNHVKLFRNTGNYSAALSLLVFIFKTPRHKIGDVVEDGG